MKRARTKGLPALAKRLRSIPGRMEPVAVREVERAASGLARAIQGAAPVVSGRVRASVRALPGESSRGRASAEVEVTGGHPDPIIGNLEFGTATAAPVPFIRSTTDGREGKTSRELAARLGRGLEGLARRG